MRRPPERPLDPLPTLKLKLSVVILAAVAVTVVVFCVGVQLGVWPSVARRHRRRSSRSSSCAFLARGMTSPLREMVDATEAMARGDFSPARHRDVARRDRHARPRRSTRWPPSSPRPTACAATSSPTSATSCARRSPRCRPCSRTSSTASSRPIPRRCARCSPRSSGSAGSCSSCSTSPGSSRARVPLDRRAFDVEPMLELAVRETAAARGRGHALGRRSSPTTFALEADAERLHQVVANLVENAVRHSPPDGDGASCARSRRGRRACASRSSTKGPGIPDADATRVFERFYRADTARSSRPRRRRARPRDRALDRRPARRRHPRRAQRAARLPHGRDAFPAVSTCTEPSRRASPHPALDDPTHREGR